MDGTLYTLEGPCEIRIREGNLTEKKFNYTPRPYNTHPYPYPAPGKVAELIYPRGDVEIKLVYEIFDNMPAIRKSLYVQNNSDRTITIDTAETEALCLTEEGNLRYYFEADYIGDNMYGFRQPYLFREGNTVSLQTAVSSAKPPTCWPTWASIRSSSLSARASTWNPKTRTTSPASSPTTTMSTIRV